jgi:hypothetical protein
MLGTIMENTVVRWWETCSGKGETRGCTLPGGTMGVYGGTGREMSREAWAMCVGGLDR